VGAERSKEIVDYYCGWPPQSALILTLTEGFEMACGEKKFISEEYSLSLY
jgi:hypothetical protein